MEVDCLNGLTYGVSVFYRYVDDVFAILPKDKVLEVVSVFNNYHPRLHFTYETEIDGCINFLDTTVIRDGNKLLTNWYRKPTFSGRYINYYSSHPVTYKVNTIISLVDRAILLSDDRFHDKNIQIVKSILGNNCFPRKLINKHISIRLNELKNKQVTTQKPIWDTKNCLVLPFYNGISDNINRKLSNYGFKTLFTVPKKLNRFIKTGKDKLNTEQMTHLIYKIDCGDCNLSYIGQTKRHLKTRIKEHRNNISKHDNLQSVVSHHRVNNGHDFDWSTPRVLHFECHTRKREIAEMVFIKKFNNNINLQRDTERLKDIYNNIIQLF